MSSKRIKTKYVGVYYRYADSRRGIDGKPDKCYDIYYKKGNKNIWEKVGWRSEGYTAEDAVRIRGERVKAIRHPELFRLDTPNEVTVDELLEKLEGVWLETLRPKYRKDLLTAYNTYIQPFFGQRKVREIESIDVAKFKKFLIKDYISKKTKKNISKRTAQCILIYFKTILNKGKEFNISLNTNNIDFNIKNSTRKRERYLSKIEAFQILESLKYASCPVYYIASISLYTGLRLNEVIVLKKENIDFKSRTINVDGKTGRRPAYIPDMFIEQIKKIVPKKNGYIFKDKNGDLITKGKVYFNFMYVVNSLGLNDGITDLEMKVVFHTLRHTFCSWLAINDVSLYTIAELAGHTKVETTKRYAKLSPDAKRRAINRLCDENQE